MSAVSPGQAPQRLCPRCSTIARTVDAHCPFCGSAYRRRGPWGGVAFATLLATAAILGGIVLILVQVNQRLQDELDQQVGVVQRDLDRQVSRLQNRFERDLDQRLPPATTSTQPGG